MIHRRRSKASHVDGPPLRHPRARCVRASRRRKRTREWSRPPILARSAVCRQDSKAVTVPYPLSWQNSGRKDGSLIVTLLLWIFPLHLLLMVPLDRLQAQTQTVPAPGGTIHGTVKSGNMPIPGAVVSISQASSAAKISTWTDVDGSYSAAVPAFASYTVQVGMAAFAHSTREIVIDATHRNVQANFELTLLSRTRSEAPARPRAGGGMAGTRGFQSLSIAADTMGQVSGADSPNDMVPPGMPVPGIAPDSATESVAVSGTAANAFSSLSPEDFQQRTNDPRQPGSAFAGPGGFGGGFGGRGGGRAVFGRRGFDVNHPHGSIYYGLGDSALNAAPYSLTGEPILNPGYLQNSFGGSVGGPLNIPHIYQGGSKTFYFVNFNGKHGEQPFDQFSTVPTLLERQGNFSQASYTTGPFAGRPVELFDPATNTPFPNDTIPQVNPIAKGLLPYIPKPNLPGSVQNFRFLTSVDNSSDDLNIRVNRSLGAATFGGRRGGRNGPRNNLTFGFHFHQSSLALTNPFPSVGGTTTVRSFDVPVSYVRSWGKLTNIVRADFNRSRTRTQNLYAFNQDITGALGIAGVSANPFDWGLPNLAFTNFASLQDVNPQLLRNQTVTFTDNVIWNHGKHTWRWGADFRRIQLNTETDSNARGSFIFTGLNTSQILGGQPVPGTGYDFADFLLGLPQETSVQYGENNYHFRGDSWDAFAQDEWKLRGNLTFNLGVRWEYVSPFTEINNRLANLDLSPGVLNPALGAALVARVVSGESGPFSGPLPPSLVRPDRNNFAPRVGFAWKPLSNTVVRGGYGINYNTGAFQGIVQQLGFQPPFSTTSTNIQSAPGELTLAQGFPAVSASGITNNYAVNPDYRMGYVQIRNLDIQQQIRPTLLLNLDYTGTKGTDLDILEAPNRTATGIRIAGVQAFTYENSLADSAANAASVRLRKRLSHGFSFGGIYTFSKSIDNASSIGAGATASPSTAGLGAGGTGAAGSGPTASSGTSTVAQNPFDLAAERGLSSFNQTHRFTADYLWEPPFGHDKHWLSGNTPWRAIFGDWQWSGDWTIASGLPFTPHLQGDPTDVNRGTNGTLRPDLVPGQSISISNPSIARWFNTAAFVAPAPGQYGDARRNCVIGPGTHVFDMAFTKVFPIREAKVLEFRAQATNIFNMPQYVTIDTAVNSPTFGRVTAVGAMRQLTLTSRFRF
jgi:trimeric autotransporter adhesin